jgi:hypothetical protein
MGCVKPQLRIEKFSHTLSTNLISSLDGDAVAIKQLAKHTPTTRAKRLLGKSQRTHQSFLNGSYEGINLPKFR